MMLFTKRWERIWVQKPPSKAIILDFVIYAALSDMSVFRDLMKSHKAAPIAPIQYATRSDHRKPWPNTSRNRGLLLIDLSNGYCTSCKNSMLKQKRIVAKRENNTDFPVNKNRNSQ